MTYTLKVAGLTRELPLCRASDDLDIAAFVMLSDVELTERCAEELLKIAPPDFDIIITAETKGIPLAYEMSKQSGKKYYIGRKSAKLYMTDPIMVEVKSITTDHVQKLYLSQEDIAEIKGKKVLIVDDVISTGDSLAAIEKLVNKAGGEIAAKVAVLAEGAAADRTDITYLEKLPVFPRKK